MTGIIHDVLGELVLEALVDVTHMVCTVSLAEARKEPDLLPSPKILLTDFSAAHARPLNELPLSLKVIRYFNKVSLKV